MPRQTRRHTVVRSTPRSMAACFCVRRSGSGLDCGKDAGESDACLFMLSIMGGKRRASGHKGPLDKHSSQAEFAAGIVLTAQTWSIQGFGASKMVRLAAPTPGGAGGFVITKAIWVPLDPSFEKTRFPLMSPIASSAMAACEITPEPALS